MKITRQLDLAIERRELAHGLAHQARLEADERVPHLAFDLRPRHERRHGVDDDHVDRVRAHERVDDLERLLARVGLADQEVVELDPELARVGRVEGVLGVDEGGDAAALLGVGDDVQGEGGLARALRAEDLDDAPARQALAAEGQVEGDRARRDAADLPQHLAFPEAHDRPAAVALLDLGEGRGERLLARRGFLVGGGVGFVLRLGLAARTAHGCAFLVRAGAGEPGTIHPPGNLPGGDHSAPSSPLEVAKSTAFARLRLHSRPSGVSQRFDVHVEPLGRPWRRCASSELTPGVASSARLARNAQSTRHERRISDSPR